MIITKHELEFVGSLSFAISIAQLLECTQVAISGSISFYHLLGDTACFFNAYAN